MAAMMPWATQKVSPALAGDDDDDYAVYGGEVDDSTGAAAGTAPLDDRDAYLQEVEAALLDNDDGGGADYGGAATIPSLPTQRSSRDAVSSANGGGFAWGRSSSGGAPDFKFEALPPVVVLPATIDEDPAELYLRLERTYDRMETALHRLAIAQVIMAFPIGLLYEDNCSSALCGVSASYGRRHMQVGVFFLVASTSCAIFVGWLAYFLSPFLFPYIAVSVRTRICDRPSARGWRM